MFYALRMLTIVSLISFETQLTFSENWLNISGSLNWNILTFLFYSFWLNKLLTCQQLVDLKDIEWYFISRNVWTKSKAGRKNNQDFAEDRYIYFPWILEMGHFSMNLINLKKDIMYSICCSIYWYIC